MDIREELALIMTRMESEGVPYGLEHVFTGILRENSDPPPPAPFSPAPFSPPPPFLPPPPPFYPPPADSHSGGSVSYTPLGSAPPLPEHQLSYIAAPITMQPSHMYGQPGTASQGQLPVNNSPSATTATVLPAPPPHSCAPKKHQTKQGKDQAYIKKPPNAFMLYLKEQRPKVKAELNISDSAAVNAAVGERWKSLSKKEQNKYFDEAEIQRCHHATEHPNWSTKENYGKKRKRVRDRNCTKEDAQQAKTPCMRPSQAESSSSNSAMKEPHQLDRVWVCQPQTQPGVNTLINQNTVLVQMPNTLDSVPVCNVPCPTTLLVPPASHLESPPFTPLISSTAPSSSNRITLNLSPYPHSLSIIPLGGKFPRLVLKKIKPTLIDSFASKA